MLYNSNREYIQWLWKYLCELVVKSNLDDAKLDSRNGHMPLRTDLKPLTKTNNVENFMHLQNIQFALIQERISYSFWPHGVCNIFQGDFKQINIFCKIHIPTLPMAIEAALQVVYLFNDLQRPVDAFLPFQSGPL